MTLDDIADDDPELIALLRTLRKATFSIGEIVENGPAKRRKVYTEIEKRRLRVAYCGVRPFATNLDYGKWLLLMRRESAASAIGQQRGEKARALVNKRYAGAPATT